MKSYKTYLELLLLCVLMLQFFAIPVGGTHLKPYMFICVAFFFLLVGSGRFIIYRLKTFEIAWISTYILSMISIVYASNTKLAVQLALGECILLLFFFIFRFLLVKNGDKDIILGKVFALFIFTSFIIFVIGCVQVFVFGNSSFFFQELNEHSYRVWGCYFERDTFPRLMGVSESPNNFEYFAITILWWSIWKQKKLLSYVTLVSILLTVSTTAFVVLSVQFVFYVLYKRKISWKFFVIVSFFAYLGSNLVADNDFIQGMIELRKARNETGSGRYELWAITLNKIEERPIFGYGLNQFRAILPAVEKASAHNNILETLISTGAVGFLFYFFFLITFISYCIILSRRYKDPFFILTIIAFVLFGLANNTLTIEYVPFMLALMYSYGLRNSVSNIVKTKIYSES